MQFLVLLVLAIEIRFVPAKLLGRRDLGVFAGRRGRERERSVGRSKRAKWGETGAVGSAGAISRISAIVEVDK